MASTLGKVITYSFVVARAFLESHGSQEGLRGTSRSRRGAPDCRPACRQLYSGEPKGESHDLFQEIAVAVRQGLRMCWLDSQAPHEEHQVWHCPGWSTSLQASLHSSCMNRMRHSPELA